MNGSWIRPCRAARRPKRYHFFNTGVEPLLRLGDFPEWSANMALYAKMYLPVLFSFGIITAGYVVLWVMNGGGIDPGPPNARL